MDASSETIDSFIAALARRSALHRAIGVLVQQRSLTPVAAEELIRNEALVLGVPAEEIAAGILRSFGEDEPPS
jgi:AmiR/NasT family two-component response regulator